MEPETELGSSSVIVREATVADAAPMARALVAAWRAAYRGIIGQDFLEAMDEQRIGASWRETLVRGAGVPPLVIVSANHVVGFCQVGEPRDKSQTDTGELFALNLHPDAWGHGLGSALLSAASAQLLALGYRRAYLWVADGNQRAIDLYLRHGWHDTAITKTEYKFTPPLLEHRYAILLS
ncbi:GNAT family N-acetyltransferase [Paeniglutamicibacter sp. Y32M11]|uniref:GNAT family N-acetyltransferase n=1 Tax=Paeniglutamicibacter sp. Y32M11 TaxID=2853258 RepID=UPI001C532448|nr:GNAT family N-acetyltransferase [Paeniglutamicibacter sp. Y32M11]QXQ09227.1 GNAT family N-acetyltransferase [Paeniglutamicibacter sp. Y32M11]